MKPKVSICCLAYNHAKFIRKALDGFVMQKTNFPFEVIIHDDASTDGTADIIREYADKYPEIIKPIYQTENQYSKGKSISKNFLWPHVQGEYLAMNEGDDYWTDENKLQKQVDYLDAHPDVSVCFHPVQVIWEDGSQPDSIFPLPKYRFNKTILTLEDLLKHNFIQTNSVVYRWRLKENEELFPTGILPGDYFLHLLHAQVGKIAFLPDIMSVYRRHAGGIWTGAGETDNWFLKCSIPHLKFYQEVERQFNTDKSDDIENMMRKAISVFVRHQNWDKLKQCFMIFPERFEKIITANNPASNTKKYFKKYKKYYKITKILIGIIIILSIGLILK